VRKESQYPYEWGRPNSNGDQILRNLSPGSHTLKVKIVDKCGKVTYQTKEISIYVT
jgi:hypothetical protein